MRFRHAVAAGACVLALGAPACLQRDVPGEPAARDIHLPNDSTVIESRVPPNATLATLLRTHDLGTGVVAAIVDASHRVFDVRRLRAEQPYRLEVTAGGEVREFVYRIDGDRYLRVTGPRESRPSPTPSPDPFVAEIVAYRKDVSLTTLRATIDRDRPSLVAAIAGQGEAVALAIAIADIFGGEIDFNSELQPGDHFQVVFEKHLSEGRFSGYGPVLAAEFHNDGRVIRAFRFQGDGKEAGYYDEHGRSLKRFFLRSPLKFEPRISSGFTMRRLHPVLGTWRAHPAIDYVAPVGTPVVAVASGVVTHAGWTPGGGKTVTIRHGRGGYESSYLHLSAITVRTGARVDQGQVIGRVGCTGLCTGPHLDYRLKRDGRWVNPLTEHRKLPPGEPVAPHLRAAFDEVRAVAEARFLPRPATAP